MSISKYYYVAVNSFAWRYNLKPRTSQLQDDMEKDGTKRGAEKNRTTST